MSFQNSNPLQRKPYVGSKTSIVIGIDIGTTYSGVSYAFLRPGLIPEVLSVSSFTDQVTGDTKIPSVLYYNADGQVMAAGATVLLSETEIAAEINAWVKVEHFKMHMRPKNSVLNTHGLQLCPLPDFKTPVEVFGDFLRYLYEETVTFIKRHHADSDRLWNEVKDDAVFVLSHPNGWIGPPQQRIRQAAVHAGLIPDTHEGQLRVKLITEGEASALACLSSGLGPAKLETGFHFVVVDAGGGTIDLSSYVVSSSDPLTIEECATPGCTFAGSIFVNMRARKLFKEKLSGTKYDSPQTFEQLEDEFEMKTKRLFKSSKGAVWLKVGGTENNAKLDMWKGRLKFEGRDIADCFMHSVIETISQTKEQLAQICSKDTPIWLVGGFAASPWLQDQLREIFGKTGHTVLCPDANLSKAVANGAISFFVDRLVAKRITRWTYAVKCATSYYDTDPEHRKRSNKLFVRPSGAKSLRGSIAYIVHKGIATTAGKLFTHSFSNEVTIAEHAEREFDLFVYCGELGTEPKWQDEKGWRSFSKLCTIKGDMSGLCTESRRRQGLKEYWAIYFDVELKFGMTELEARISWKENGLKKYGPVTIVYDDNPETPVA